MSQSTLVTDLQALVATPSVNPFDGPAETPPPEDAMARLYEQRLGELGLELGSQTVIDGRRNAVSYTHLRAHEPGRNRVCRGGRG